MPFENYIVFKFFRRNWERVGGGGGGVGGRRNVEVFKY